MRVFHSSGRFRLLPTPSSPFSLLLLDRRFQYVCNYYYYYYCYYYCYCYYYYYCCYCYCKGFFQARAELASSATRVQ